MTTTKKDGAGYTCENASQVRIHLGETMFMEWKEEGGSGETEVGKQKEEGHPACKANDLE